MNVEVAENFVAVWFDIVSQRFCFWCRESRSTAIYITTWVATWSRTCIKEEIIHDYPLLSITATIMKMLKIQTCEMVVPVSVKVCSVARGIWIWLTIFSPHAILEEIVEAVVVCEVYETVLGWWIWLLVTVLLVIVMVFVPFPKYKRNHRDLGPGRIPSWTCLTFLLFQDFYQNHI